MRIVINGWFLLHDAHTGSGQYLRALLEWLPQVAPQHEYHVVVPGTESKINDVILRARSARRISSGDASAHPSTFPRPRSRGARDGARGRAPRSSQGADLSMTDFLETLKIEIPGVALHAVPCGASNFDKLRFEQLLFPRACRVLSADLAHVPYWAPPLTSPVPLVVTIHDLIPRLLPEYRGGLLGRAYTALVSAASAGVAMALADSEASRLDILQELGLPPEKVRTIYLAAGADYTPQSGFLLDEAVRQKYDLTDGYVLYLGGFDARKNVRALLSAWTWAADAVGQGYPLVLGGQLPKPDGRLFDDLPRLVAELKIADTVKFIGPVAEADKPALYRSASVFVYPSRYEGFGLPPLEAMACGVPVVSGNGGSLPEVVGDAGYILPPNDTRSLGAAIITCLVEPSVADSLRERGLAQAKKFSWGQTARETVAAYEAAVK